MKPHWPTLPQWARRTDRPTHALYSDQRKFGLTLSLRAKLLLLVIVFSVATNGIVLLVMSDTIANGHRQRVNDERQLACLLVQDTPPGNDLGDQIRAKYNCPAYSNRSTGPTPTSTKTVRVPGPTATKTKTMPGTGHTVTVPRPTPGAPKPTSRHRSKPPTRPPRPHPTGGTTSTLCQVLPLICQLSVPPLPSPLHAPPNRRHHAFTL